MQSLSIFVTATTGDDGELQLLYQSQQDSFEKSSRPGELKGTGFLFLLNMNWHCAR